MKNVPAIRTRESRAVLGSSLTFAVPGTELFSAGVRASVAFPSPVPFPNEQRLRGCSLKICTATNKIKLVTAETETKHASYHKNSPWFSM